MKRILYLLLFILVLLSAMFFQFTPVEAQNLKEQISAQYDKAAESGDMGEASSPQRIIAYVVEIILTTVGIVFLGLIVYGSYNLITAGGDEEKVKKALSTIRPALIGFIIIMMAYGLTIFIGSRVQQSVTQGVQVDK